MLAQHPRCLLGPDLGAGGDDEEVVGELLARLQDHPLLVRLHGLHRGADPLDSGAEGLGPGPEHPLRLLHPEGHEDEVGLEEVVYLRIHYLDRPLGGEPLAHLIGDGGARGAGSQDRQILHSLSSFPAIRPRPRREHGPCQKLKSLILGHLDRSWPTLQRPFETHRCNVTFQ